MFEQHPVPQQISSYQFRLVGDMTLKQFFQLAAGAVVGLIVYSLPLPGFFKWPLIAVVVIGGAAFAFLPIQDRPLEQWLIAFFRSIYAPTIFVWKKAETPVQYFATDATTQPVPTPEEVSEGVPNDVPTHVLEQNEQNFLSRISSMFGGPTSPLASQGQVPDVQPELSKEPEPEPSPTSSRLDGTTLGAQQKPIEVKPQGFEIPTAAPPVQTTPLGQVFSAQLNTQATQAAQFSPEAAPPTPPTSPNIIVGQVMDVNGKIVEGAILEITDADGRPVRALKSNRAGHFMIVTPLPDGRYSIIIEQEGLGFEPITVTLNGSVLSPIAIKSTDAIPEPVEPEGRAVWNPQ